MSVENIENILESLERQELENAASGSPVLPEVYAKILAIYLYQNDMCNAKYLWKRIPTDTKSLNPILGKIWNVGQKMWQRDFSGIYLALSQQWPPELKEIMDNILESTRDRAGKLVATAYNFITLDKLAEVTGLTADDAAEQAASAGWHVDRTTNLVKPNKPPAPPAQPVSCEDQLSKLTDFVSFLEN